MEKIILEKIDAHLK